MDGGIVAAVSGGREIALASRHRLSAGTVS